ncbi:hypothetical protein [Methylorubrum thiocyanatum]
MIAPEITDHALLRWMERVHGIDVEGWRALMRAEFEDALRAYVGEHQPGLPGFVIAGPRIVTVIGPGQKPSRREPGAVCVPRLP